MRAILGQKAREAFGFANVTKDSDVVAMTARLTELEKDVHNLKKVLETTSKVLNQQLVSARAQVRVRSCPRDCGFRPPATTYPRTPCCDLWLASSLPCRWSM